MAVCEGEGVLRLKRETMAIPMLRAAMISHSQSQPLIHSISAIYETAKRRKRVVFSSSSSSELNPVIR